MAAWTAPDDCAGTVPAATLDTVPATEPLATITDTTMAVLRRMSITAPPFTSACIDAEMTPSSPPVTSHREPPWSRCAAAR
jgi:hypothetical protein